MRDLFFLSLLLASAFSFRFNHQKQRNHRPEISPLEIQSSHITTFFPSSNTISFTQLYAKKKGPKLISDDLLSTLAEEPEVQQAVAITSPPATQNSPPSPQVSKKDKKLAKFGLSESLLSSIEELDAENVANPSAALDAGGDSPDDAGESSGNGKKKDKKKDKKKNKGGNSDTSDIPDEDEQLSEVRSGSEGVATLAPSTAAIPESQEDDADTETSETPVLVSSSEPTLEQRLRKEKGSSRVRFAESSQPDYVMLALEKVSLVYGNEVILKDATFSCVTGERVGLVGPNGGGKTTSLKILSGEVESTTGEVVKSSRDLRIAFLRQEFNDELNPTNTLKQELRSAFVVENALLNAIAKCEDDIALYTNDPPAMEKALNQLAELQDKAISKGAYALDSKVDKIMESAGFGQSDGELPVTSFSGGWKMRIGIAKILLQDPNVLLLDEVRRLTL